jgi:hypothetical protein
MSLEALRPRPRPRIRPRGVMEYWSEEYCAKSNLRPAFAGLEVLKRATDHGPKFRWSNVQLSQSTASSGQVICFDRHLGLKPQA